MTGLSEHYTERRSSLTPTAIAKRFTTQYTSMFSKLSGAYRSDVKAIKAARKDGKLPPRVADDLTLLGAAQKVGTRIDGAAERMRAALGLLRRWQGHRCGCHPPGARDGRASYQPQRRGHGPDRPSRTARDWLRTQPSARAGCRAAAGSESKARQRSPIGGALPELLGGTLRSCS